MTRWKLAHGQHLDLGAKALLMGILNVTPDSFSDGGEFVSLDRAIAHARQMMADGAAIIDVGGESTRPGAEPVAAREEQSRILPVIEALSADGRASSRSTPTAPRLRVWRSRQARISSTMCMACSASPTSRGWRRKQVRGLSSCIPAGTAKKSPTSIADQFFFLERSLEIARQAGVADDQIVLDPGFGFAKDGEENLQLMARFGELRPSGFPAACRHIAQASDRSCVRRRQGRP